MSCKLESFLGREILKKEEIYSIKNVKNLDKKT